MSASPDAPEGRDIVRLRAVFVPDGQTPSPELLEGMVDVIRLNVRLPSGGDGTPTTPRNETGQPPASP